MPEPVYNVLFLCTAMNRISAFTALPVASLDESSLKVQFIEIGQAEGASKPHISAA